MHSSPYLYVCAQVMPMPRLDTCSESVRDHKDTMVPLKVYNSLMYGHT